MNYQISSKKILYFGVGTLLLISTVFFTKAVEAATMSLSPFAAQTAPGKLVTIRVSVNTQDKYINNSEGTIAFSADLLEVVSVNSQNSIFTLWVERPNYSNSAGTVSFNGGVPNPGYNGNGGEALSIVFKAKKAGTASISFSGVAIRENDGLGTDIFSGSNSIQIGISEPVAEVKKETPQTITKQNLDVSSDTEKNKTPETENGSVRVYSSTHSDQGAWYSARDVALTWQLPADALAVQTFMGHSTVVNSYVLYKAPINHKEIDGVKDGVWYFNIRYQTSKGWSKVTSFRINIDTQPPTKPSVKIVDIENGKKGLMVDADDTLSGIDYYNIIIDNQTPIKVTAKDAVQLVKLPILSSDTHNIIAEVYDKAGNKNEIETSIIIDQTTPPVINNYFEKITTGQSQVVSGSSIYARTKIIFTYKEENGVENNSEITTDDSGNFVWKSEPINFAGNYQFWAYVNGVEKKGLESPKYDFKVGQSEQAIHLKTTAEVERPVSRSYNYLWIVVVSLLALIIILLVYIFFLRKKLNLEKNKSKQFLQELIERANSQTDALEGKKNNRAFNKRERDALEDLKGTIDLIEKAKE
jgi:hypothetical protein